MKLFRIAIVLSVLSVVALTTVSADACRPVKTQRLGSKANGKTVGLAVGGQLFVSLKGNATTGYAWKIASVSRSVLQPSPIKYVQNPNPKHLLGVGGVYKLNFKGLARGTTVLKLVYTRGSELGELFWLRVVVS
jgi:predicted secreted protein